MSHTNMAYSANGVFGAVESVEPDVVDAATVATGQFTGAWRREGSTITMHNTMHNTMNTSDGSENFDVIAFDARGDTLTHQVFVVK